MKKQRYDLIVSIGEACSCTETLRAAKLQFCSYPLDWLAGATFLQRVQIICSDFDNFLNKQDLVNLNITNDIQKDIYKNKHTELILNHDFRHGIDFDQEYEEVFQKYSRRINRLLTHIRQAQSILFMFMETPNTILKTSDNDLIQGLNLLKQKYPNKQIHLVYWRNNFDLAPQTYHISHLNQNITQFVAHYKSQKPNAHQYEVNIRFTARLMRSLYHLNEPIFKVVKRFLIKQSIKLVPFRKNRHTLRKKYHV